jgi:hypothetical protein
MGSGKEKSGGSGVQTGGETKGFDKMKGQVNQNRGWLLKANQLSAHVLMLNQAPNCGSESR